MADTVTARFVRKVGNTPAGTVRELPEDHPALRFGMAEIVKGKAAPTEPDLDTEAAAAEIDSMTLPQLRKEAERRGQDSKGTKKELLARLRPDPRGEHGNEGGEEPGEGVPPEEATNDDLTDTDGGDKIEDESIFADPEGKHDTGEDGWEAGERTGTADDEEF